MSPAPRVFLDTCCVMSAAISTEGASNYVFTLAQEGKVELVMTRHVLQSAIAHLNEQERKGAVKNLLVLLSNTDHEVIEDVTEEQEERWTGVTHDRRVLAGALAAGAQIVLSSDEKHVVTERVAECFPLKAMTPKSLCDWLRFLPESSESAGA